MNLKENKEPGGEEEETGITKRDMVKMGVFNWEVKREGYTRNHGCQRKEGDQKWGYHRRQAL